MPIVNRIAEFAPEMTEWRRDLHAHPELGFQETRTSDVVAAKLATVLQAEKLLMLTNIRGGARQTRPAADRIDTQPH